MCLGPFTPGRSSGLSTRACGCVPACVHKRVRAGTRPPGAFGCSGPRASRGRGRDPAGLRADPGLAQTRAALLFVCRLLLGGRSLRVGCCSAAALCRLQLRGGSLRIGCCSAAAPGVQVAARRLGGAAPPPAALGTGSRPGRRLRPAAPFPQMPSAAGLWLQ